MFNRPVAGVGKGNLAQNPARTICLSFLLIIGVGTLLLMLPFSARGPAAPPSVTLSLPPPPPLASPAWWFTTPGATGPAWGRGLSWP